MKETTIIKMPKQLEALLTPEDREFYQQFRAQVTEQAMKILKNLVKKIREFNALFPIESEIGQLSNVACDHSVHRLPPSAALSAAAFPSPSLMPTTSSTVAGVATGGLPEESEASSPREAAPGRSSSKDKKKRKLEAPALQKTVSRTHSVATARGAETQLPSPLKTEALSSPSLPLSPPSLPSQRMPYMIVGEGKVREDGKQVSAIYTEVVRANDKIIGEMRRLKAQAAELIEMVSTVKLWILLNVPSASTGDNFGVSVQEDVINELAKVEDSACNTNDAYSKYLGVRAKLVSKILKYPALEDYRMLIRDLDEKQMMHIRITDMDNRNAWVSLLDLLSKNWSKIVTPRNEQSSSMVC